MSRTIWSSQGGAQRRSSVAEDDIPARAIGSIAGCEVQSWEGELPLLFSGPRGGRWWVLGGSVILSLVIGWSRRLVVDATASLHILNSYLPRAAFLPISGGVPSYNCTSIFHAPSLAITRDGHLQGGARPGLRDLSPQWRRIRRAPAYCTTPLGLTEHFHLIALDYVSPNLAR